MYIGKLVRDGVPERIRRNGRGETPKFRTLSPAEAFPHLLAKLVEEAGEVKDAKNRSQFIEEMGDLEEVIETLLRNREVTHAEVSAARTRKLASHGSFSQYIFLERVTS